MRMDINNRELVKQDLTIVFHKHTYNKLDRWFTQIIVNRDECRVSGIHRDAVSFIQARLDAEMSIYRSDYQETAVSSYSKYLSNQLTYKLPDHYDR